jgi:26S proteasome regulatory subunit N2
VSLSNASLTVPLVVSLVPKEYLVAYQLAFDLAEGGSQEFLNSVQEGLPGDESVCPWFKKYIHATDITHSLTKKPLTS